MSDERRRWLKGGAYAIAALALAAVFAAYLNPHLMFDIASRVWACF